VTLVTTWRRNRPTVAAAPAPERLFRVLMVTSEWPRPHIPSTTNFIRRQAESLQAAGISVDVFAFRGAGNPYNYLNAWTRLRPLLAQGNYDLVHAQFGQSGLITFPKRLPLVVTLRGGDLLGIISDETGKQTLGGRVLQQATRYVARRANAVILVSDHMRRFLRTKAPVYVIPSGLDLTLFRPIPRDEARRQLGWNPNDRVVLFAARPQQARKRFDLASAAVALVNQRLPARIEVAWGVPHSRIPLMMNAADCLIMTSMIEGSPNVVKEALACDLPVVSVPVGDVHERLGGVDGCELTTDDRPQTLAAALERVLRRGGRVEGRAAVRSLDEQLLTQRVIQVYRSVLAKR
jgi:teichuronic acid biosynthesis glycosyltransferase TuaC